MRSDGPIFSRNNVNLNDHTFYGGIGKIVEKLVWYDIHEDQIYVDGILSAYFYSLTNIDDLEEWTFGWDRFVILGFL